MRPNWRRWTQCSQATEWRHVSWLFTSPCDCFTGRSDRRNQARTNDTVLFEFLVEYRLTRKIQPLAANRSSCFSELARDFLAARRDLLQLLRKLQIGQSFVPSF